MDPRMAAISPYFKRSMPRVQSVNFLAVTAFWCHIKLQQNVDKQSKQHLQAQNLKLTGYQI